MSLIAKAVWNIEARLREPLSLTKLAALCGVRSFHLSRVFRSGTGLSVMTYVRARRLSEAARRLALSDDDILMVALDAHYGSHEAFTRAFSTYFGVLPSTIRKGRTLSNLATMEPWKMDTSLIVDVDRPLIKEREAFRLTGMSRRYTFEENSGIPALWREFNERSDEVSSEVESAAYGVCYDADAEGWFSYLVGFETTGTGSVPSGMDRVEVPAGRYGVFAHTGHISDLRRTVYTIWNKALADNDLVLRQAPDFELYDKRFDPSTGRGIVEIWLPVD